MKRYSWFLLPALLLAVLVPVVSSPSTVSAIAGAAFTTVNVALDGPGHCRNGNPPVNCNIYNGKQYVWLNGGPRASRLGPDGQYFFAVLAPGGQPTPNDGGAKNLSDNYDAYTNRTFTVKNGKVNAYAGTHTFDRGLIRLLPYADTPNPGGVYTLAVCSLARGYPVTASACKYDQFKVTGVCQPQVVKVNFAALGDGALVEGQNRVVPGLDIESPDGPGRVRVILLGSQDGAYGAGVGNAINNGGVDPILGGFSDMTAAREDQPHHYIFTFDLPVSNFSLRMLDFGDYNPTKVKDHLVTITAYDMSGAVLPPDVLQYESDSMKNPATSWNPDYGPLQTTGDAIQAQSYPLPKKPGWWMWQMSGTGIKKVTLDMGVGPDPNTGFDSLTYTSSGCP